MPSNRYRSGFVATAEDGATLTLAKGKKGKFEVSYNPATDALKVATQMHSGFMPPITPILLLAGDQEADQLVQYPLNTTSTNIGFLNRKYERIGSIMLAGFGLSSIDSVEDVQMFLQRLPSGFVKDAFFGLGLSYDLRYLIAAVEDVDNVDHLWVKRGRRDGLPKLDGSSYVIAASQFDEARRAVRRTHDRALRMASQQKRIVAHNSLLTALDSTIYPAKSPPYRKDALFEVLGGGIARQTDLSPADRKVAISATHANARAAVSSDPDELYELTREVEVVTLEVLLEKLHKRIKGSYDENAWQSFFLDNPFILRLAFGLPVMMVGGHITVGGRRLNGSGDKITDFAAKAVSTGNLALIEIKTPKTALLGTKPYRGGIYAPSGELSGAVNQLLDQRYQLQTNISALKVASRIYDIESYAVQGLVIAGQSPTDADQQKSLELFRNGLKSITVVTYDELVAKLELILQMLSAPPEVTATAP